MNPFLYIFLIVAVICYIVAIPFGFHELREKQIGRIIIGWRRGSWE